MIEAIDLTVRRRGRTVLDAVSFDVRPGQVTGVLGGTGAGKTVLLRRMVDLERGRGETLFDGRPYRALRRPMREVGLLLDPTAGDPDRTVRGHLRLALATDRGAARQGVLASARQSAVSGAVADRHGHGDRSGNAEGLRAVGARSNAVRDGGRADAGRDGGRVGAVRDGGRIDPGRDGGRVDAGRDDTRSETTRDGARVGAGRDGADTRARDGAGGVVAAESLGLDPQVAAELAEALGSRGEFAEIDVNAVRGRARRSGQWHGDSEDAYAADHRRWLRFGRGRRHSGAGSADLAEVTRSSRGGGYEDDLVDLVEATQSARGQGNRHDESDLADRIERTRRGRPADRIDAVLDIVGLTDQSRTRLSELTEGMATRLGIAVALLGDPKTLLLDCPDRGLEPEGVAWLGALLRAFTAQGRAALVTGSDTETLIAMVDRVLLLDSGYLVGTRTTEEVLRAPTGASVVVRSPQIVRFAAILAEAGARSTQGEGACLEVRGLDRARVGDLAYRNSIPVHELSDHFSGSDPGDRVLAACTGRRARPVVPIQGFPDGKRVVGVPTPVSVGTSAASSGVRTWGAKALRPARVGGSGSSTPGSNVRVMNVDDLDEFGESSVRLITVTPAVEAQPKQAVHESAVHSGPTTDERSASADTDTESSEIDSAATPGETRPVPEIGSREGEQSNHASDTGSSGDAASAGELGSVGALGSAGGKRSADGPGSDGDVGSVGEAGPGGEPASVGGPGSSGEPGSESAAGEEAH